MIMVSVFFPDCVVVYAVAPLVCVIVSVAREIIRELEVAGLTMITESVFSPYCVVVYELAPLVCVTVVVDCCLEVDELRLELVGRITTTVSIPEPYSVVV
jgi:hypothetical protein